MGTAQGADVSAIQSTGDWSRYDLAFLIAKASEGQTTRDAKFTTHIATARAKGLVTGGYHFGWPVQPVADEAANYVAAVKSAAAAGVFTHWLDLEAYADRRNVGSMTAAQIKSWATAWIAAVRRAFPSQKVGVYASLATFQAGWVPTNADAYWVAQYPVAGLTWADAAKRDRPTLPKGYPTPLIWQFASSSPALDRDLAYLSSTDLAAWAAEGGDDVALTTDDINKVASAVVDKLIAGGGVLESSDLTAVAKAVLNTDGIIAAPADAPDVKTNPFWALQSYIKDTNARLRAVEAALAPLAAAVEALNGAQIAADAAAALSGYQLTVTKES